MTLDQLFKDTFLMELLDIEKGDFVDPDIDKDEDGGETVIGEMNELEIRLYTLARWKKDSIESLCPDCRDEKKDEIKAKCSPLKSQTKRLTEIMWASIQDRLNSWDYDGIGVREGFQIVSFDNRESQHRKRSIGIMMGSHPSDHLDRLLERLHRV